MKSKQALFESLDWALFSYGIIVSAFLLPATILVTLILQQPLPNGPLSAFPVIPLTRVYLFLLLGGAAWHAVHRIRFVLFGLGLSRHRRSVTAVTTAGLVLALFFVAKISFTF
jgi:fumarate reductase subunit D